MRVNIDLLLFVLSSSQSQLMAGAAGWYYCKYRFVGETLSCGSPEHESRSDGWSCWMCVTLVFVSELV